MPEVLLFAQAREAAGSGSVRVDGSTVDEVMDNLTLRFGPAMADIVAVSRIWANGEPATGGQDVGVADEIAVLPPVSGG